MNDEKFDVSCADWLAPFLLLSLRERDSHEHELARRMPDLGFGATPPGTVYRTLLQMEREGMIASETGGFDGRPSRRRFSITGSDEDCLESWANALARHEDEVDLFLSTHAERPARRAG